MTATTLLDRLDGVRATGPGRWIAQCPAHPDKRPS
ncbi:MAG: DNA primase, partial [Betaproteobacteria bacterium]|nr:DNA primase [Betaproteobacteria bacterium]